MVEGIYLNEEETYELLRDGYIYLEEYEIHLNHKARKEYFKSIKK